MKERIEEYEYLRNEIISLEDQQRNVWLYMYILFCSLFVLGLQWSRHLFLVIYIILIPFQCIINDYNWSITKLSTYIRLFFEDERTNMNWESFHIFPHYQEYYCNRSNNIIGFIRTSGSVHLGFLTSSFFCMYTLKSMYQNNQFSLSIWDSLLVLLSVVLFFILFIINKEYKNNYFNELENIMKEYKKSI